MLSGRSLIYNRNSRGASTVPWGNPGDTGADVDVLPSQITACCLPSRNDLNQFKTVDLEFHSTPVSSEVDGAVLCQRLL